MKTIGILNLQGAVTEHVNMLHQLDHITPVLVKQPKQLDNLDGLIIPGGESTAISRLIKENDLFTPIQQFAKAKKGVFGTCAGLVLCGQTTTQISEADKVVIPLELIDIVVERNGFGRQVDSFETEVNISEIGENIPAVFIRAPYIASFGNNVTPLAYIDKHCVMAKYNNILVCSFHPELTNDVRIMRYFSTQFC